MPAQASPAFASLDATVIAAFGETCWFYPQAGEPREVSAVIVQISGTNDDESGGIDSEERLEILVGRDDADAGISKVAIGEGFRRDTDPADVRYAYTGEKRDVSDSAWELAFVRRVPFQKGGRNIR